jgi:oligogalacturonide transport system substrate-binding protein
MEEYRMNTVSRVLLTALLASLLTALPAGCNWKPEWAGSPFSSRDGGGEEQVRKTTTLRFSWWGANSRHKATLDAISAYMESHPDVKIEAEYMAFDGYQKKLLTQISGNRAPDIFQGSICWYPDIDGSNYLDLSKYPDFIDLGQFEKAYRDECTYNGRLQALPAGILSTATLYNKDFFQKYGIPEDTVWTFEKVLEVGEEIHKKDPNVYLTTGDLDVVNRLWVTPYLSQKTGDIWIRDDCTMAFDRSILVETLDYVRKLYDTGALEPLGTATAFLGKMEQNPKWIKGEIGMNVGLTSGMAGMMEANPGVRYGVTDIPMHPDAKESANPTRSSVVLSVYSKSRAPEEALKFLNWFLNDEEAALILLEHRGTPASGTARETLLKNNRLDPLIAEAMGISAKNPGKIPNAASENVEIWQINKDVITKLAFHTITPEQGADEIIRGYTAKLRELKASSDK